MNWLGVNPERSETAFAVAAQWKQNGPRPRVPSLVHRGFQSLLWTILPVTSAPAPGPMALSTLALCCPRVISCSHPGAQGRKQPNARA